MYGAIHSKNNNPRNFNSYITANYWMVIVWFIDLIHRISKILNFILFVAHITTIIDQSLDAKVQFTSYCH